MAALGPAGVLLVLVCSGVPVGPSTERWVFWTEPAWQAPPADLEKSYDESESEIAIFTSSGEFVWLSVTLFRDRASGGITVCRGCGFSTRVGTWTDTDSGFLLVRSRWRHLHAAPLESTEPDARAEQKWVVQGRTAAGSPASLQLADVLFLRTKTLPDAATIAELLAAD